jgi:RND family efflux transporter MFP subunit
MKRSEFALKYLLPCVALALIGFASYQSLTARPAEATVAPRIAPTMTPTRDGLGGHVAGAGVIEPSSETLAIAPSGSGIIGWLGVTAGETVARGQPLFKLDSRETSAEVVVTEAAVLSAQCNLDLARAQLQERQELLDLLQSVPDPRAFSREELLQRQAAVRNAQAGLALALAQVGEARAALGRARTRLEMLTVRAPIDATVTAVRLRPGEFASGARGDAVVTLGALTPLHVRIDVDEADIPRLQLGQEAMIVFRGSSRKAMTASFVRIEPVVGPKKSLTGAGDERVDTRVLQLIYALPPSARDVFVGEQVEAFLPAAAGA